MIGHAAVERLAVKATFIVIRVGYTEGMLWECMRLIEMSDPRRVIILNPKRELTFSDRQRDEHYRRFREMTAHLVPRAITF